MKILATILLALCQTVFGVRTTEVSASYQSAVDIVVETYFDETNTISTVVHDVQYGSRVVLTSSLQDIDGFVFSFWIVNGAVQKDYAIDHEFIVSSSMHLIAVFKPSAKNVVAFMDANGRLIDLQYVASGGSAVEPDTSSISKPGMVFATPKWSSTYANVTQDLVTVLQYSPAVVDDIRTISVVNGSGGGTYQVNTVITVSTNALLESDSFQFWRIGNRIVSYETQYSFTVLEETEIVAVFGEPNTPPEAMVSMSTPVHLRPGYQSYLCQFKLPVDATLIEYGVLYHESIVDPTFDAVGVVQYAGSKINGTTHEFLMSFPLSKNGYFRSYVIYGDADSVIHVMYNLCAPLTTGIQYESSGTQISIVGYVGTESTVIIPDTIAGLPVTSIGPSAFSGMDQIVDFAFPAYLRTIEDYAFNECDNLRQIDLPDRLLSIGYAAFHACNRLTEVALPSGLLSLESWAFGECTDLRYVQIPESVIVIDEYAFALSNQIILLVDAGERQANWSDGWDYYMADVVWNYRSTDRTDEYVYAITSTDEVYLLELAAGFVPTDVVLPSQIDGMNLIGFSGKMFSGCQTLTSIVIPETVGSVEHSAFFQCTNMISIELPEGLTVIEDYGLYGLSNVTSLIIPASVTSIGRNAITGNMNLYLRSAEQPEAWHEEWCRTTGQFVWGYVESRQNSQYEYIVHSDHTVGIWSVDESINASSVQVPAFIDEMPVSIIYEDAYRELSLMESLSIPASIREIRAMAFYSSPLLTSITFATSSALTVIGSSAFAKCSLLQDVTLPTGLLEIGYAAFSMCSSLTDIVIPDSVVTIGSNAFQYATQLQRAYLPSSVVSIGVGAFLQSPSLLIFAEAATKPTGWEVDELNKQSWNDSNRPVLWDYQETRINGEYRYAVTSSGEAVILGLSPGYAPSELVIPESLEGMTVTTVFARAFADRITLTSVVLPGTIDTIASEAFYGCESLTSVVIPSEVQTIGSMAFLLSPLLVIYAEAEAAPDGWTEGDVNQNNSLPWNPSEFPVVYGFIRTEIADGLRYAVLQGDKGMILGTTLSSSTIVIPGSIAGLTVVGIGPFAFYENSTIQEIELPNTAETLGANAFAGAGNLSRVVFGSSSALSTIGKYAFYHCLKLVSFKMPENTPLSGIGFQAFGFCRLLTDIYVPDTVVDMGGYVFNGCSSLLIFTNLAQVGSTWDSEWNNSNRPVIFSFTMQYRTFVFETNGGTSVESVSDYVLSSSPTTQRVAYLFAGWYDNAELLGDSIDFPYYDATSNGLVLYAKWDPNPFVFVLNSQGTYTVTGYEGSDVNVVIPNSYLGVAVTHIGYRAFADLVSITSVTIPESIVSMETYAFAGCTGLTTLIVLSAASEIPVAFCSGCTNLVDVQLPSAIETIGSYAFSQCSSLVELTWPVSLTTISDYAFSGCVSLTEITIPASVTTVGTHAFYQCTSLTTVEIWGDIGVIANSLFSNCTALNSILIHSDVTEIGTSAFAYCPSLTAIALPDSVVSIGGNAFSASGLSEFSFPAQVTQIGVQTFYDCSALANVVWPDHLVSIGDYAFYQCKSLTSVTLPASVETIGEGAFRECDAITNVTLSSSIITIGNEAFTSAVSLVSFVTNASISDIGDMAFYNCTKLASFVVPGTLGTIGAYAFYNCALLHFTIPSSVTAIGNSAFEKCLALQAVTIPGGVQEVGSKAFSGCTGLTSIIVSEGVTGIGSSAFSGVTNVTTLILPDTLTTIGSSAFSSLSKVSQLTLPDSLITIGSSAFSGCSKLALLDVPTSVTTIGAYAFSGCTKLVLLSSFESAPASWDVDWAGNGVTTTPSVFNVSTVIDDGEWLYAQLKDDTVTVIRPSTSSTASDMTIPETLSGLTVIRLVANAFRNNTNIRSLVVNAPITTIENYTFFYASNLSSVTYVQPILVSIGNAAFMGTKLMRFIVTTSVTTIGSGAFQGIGTASVLFVEGISAPSGWNENWTYTASQAIVWGYESTVVFNEIEYAISSDDTATVIGRQDGSLATDFVIAPVVEGYPVTGIRTDAFRGQSQMKTIHIPDCVASIGGYAFYQATAIIIYCAASSQPSEWSSTWNASNRPVYWGFIELGDDGAVKYMASLSGSYVMGLSPSFSGTDLVIPDELGGMPTVSIESYAFANASIQSVTIPSSVTSIKSFAFSTASDLSQITFEPGSLLSSIGNNAFENCFALTGINLPDDLLTIGNYAFWQCTSLTSISLPQELTTLGIRVFNSCYLLSFVLIPESVTVVGGNQFLGSSSVNVYCEAASLPAGWSVDWNSMGCPVVWGYTGS
ncbi:MAG: leucine-rich repeat protein [Candidatus Izemoplasmatales bacterium]